MRINNNLSSNEIAVQILERAKKLKEERKGEFTVGPINSDIPVSSDITNLFKVTWHPGRKELIALRGEHADISLKGSVMAYVDHWPISLMTSMGGVGCEVPSSFKDIEEIYFYPSSDGDGLIINLSQN